MKILEERRGADGRTGIVTVDECPPDMAAGDVVMRPEGAPGVLIHYPFLPPAVRGDIFGGGDYPVARALRKEGDL